LSVCLAGWLLMRHPVVCGYGQQRLNITASLSPSLSLSLSLSLSSPPQAHKAFVDMVDMSEYRTEIHPYYVYNYSPCRPDNAAYSFKEVRCSSLSSSQPPLATNLIMQPTPAKRYGALPSLAANIPLATNTRGAIVDSMFVHRGVVISRLDRIVFRQNCV
jgi:hypothetical protein